MKIKNSRGITLIALIVTIIVLLAIAGISIAALTSDNGIIKQTNTAKVDQIEGTVREQVKLAVSAMKLAVLEASGRDNSYNVSSHAGLIQAKLVEILNQDKSGLNGDFGFGGNDLDDDAAGTEIKISYTGDDYKNACNSNDAQIEFTIKLGQKLIEIAGETNSTLKDQNGNSENIEVMQPKPGLYASGSGYQVLLKDWNTLVNEGILDANGIIQTGQAVNLAGDLILPNTLTTIGEKAFSGCKNLTDIKIPTSVTSIGKNAFASCSGLTTVKIPNSVTSIEYGAFQSNINLQNIEIPETVTSIGGAAFYHCYKLESIKIPDGVTKIDTNTFYYCKALNNVELSNSLISIGDKAFYACSALESIKIPKTVTTVNEQAFRECIILKSIEVEEGNTVYHSAENCLIKTQDKVLVAGSTHGTIPADGSVTSIGNYAFEKRSGIVDLEIPNTITKIGGLSFRYCENLKTVKIPSSVTYIENSTFKTCVALESVEIEANITQIPNDMFYQCIGLKSVKLPDTITTIGAGVFCLCDSLESIEIPSKVTSIGVNAFSSLANLTNVTILATTPPTAGTNFFTSCPKLSKIYVPSASVSTYKSANGWKNFSSKIVAITT